jgi:hypothetical protein
MDCFVLNAKLVDDGLKRRIKCSQRREHCMVFDRVVLGDGRAVPNACHCPVSLCQRHLLNLRARFASADSAFSNKPHEHCKFVKLCPIHVVHLNEVIAVGLCMGG